nr:hypothetical protein [Candidatus Sigynarchaeum springense]
MLDLNAIIGEIPDDVGAVLSPIIKLLVVFFGSAMTAAMASKYRRKRRENPDDPSIVRRNMSIMLALYTGSALLACFDNLLGSKDIPYDNVYLGTTISLVLTSFANVFYFWFVLEVLYISKEIASKKRVFLAIFMLIDVVSTVSSLMLKIGTNPFYAVPLIVHAAASGFIFVLVLVKSFMLTKNSDDVEYRRKFASICIGTCFGLATLILFNIDVLSEHVTVYAVAGWLSLLALGYFLSRGYY